MVQEINKSKKMMIKFCLVAIVTLSSGFNSGIILSSASLSSGNYQAINTGADKVWQITKGNNIGICIIDTGVDDHEDFTVNYRGFHPDFSDGYDSNGVFSHGTSIVGAAFMKINNGIGYNGLAESKIFSYKIGENALDADSLDRIESGLNWCNYYTVQNTVDKMVYVMSIGYYGDVIQGIREKIQDIYSYGDSLFFAAVGNDGKKDKIWYPAAFPEVIGVGASDKYDNRDPDSNYDNGAPPAEGVQLVAPGVSVTLAEQDGNNPSRYYTQYSGSSIATPIAAAAAALVWSAFPYLGPNAVKDLLYNYARDRGNYGYDSKYGYGIVDISAAIVPNPLKPSGPGSATRYGYNSWRFQAISLVPNIYYKVDWGDGSKPDFFYARSTSYGSSWHSANLRSHTYYSIGTFQITVTTSSDNVNWSLPSPYKSVSVTSGGVGGGCNPFC